jgi:hypothetical protein
MIIQRNDKLCNSQCLDDLQEQYFSALQCIPLSAIQNTVIYGARLGLVKKFLEI